ncbi:MAG TPA: FHA domain-containing protein [Kofleriaceae bacterium]|nr:FHA domain-containing protein [Kofleriaceae bacterium]
MPPPRRPTALGPVPAPTAPGADSGRERFDEDERTTVDQGPPQPTPRTREDIDARWEEQTRREGARERISAASVAPRVGRPAEPGKVPTETVDEEVTSGASVEDEDEVTIRADEEMRNRLADGTGEVGQSTIDEPTVDEQAKPLPPLSVVPPIPAGKRGKPTPARAVSVSAGRLVVIAGNDSGMDIALQGKTVTIGRGVDCDVVLTDIAVSRKHVEVVFDGRFYQLRDLGSGNGTLINDRIEDGACELRHGDRLELGNTVIRFEHAGSKPEPAAVGWGNQVEVDDEASTIAGRQHKSSEGARPRAPLPQPNREEPRRLVLPARPPGAHAPELAQARAGTLPPVRAQAPEHPERMDPSYMLPVMANAVSLPGNPMLAARQNRALIGIISVTLAIVILAIVATVLRGDESKDVVAAAEPANPAQAVEVSAGPEAEADTDVHPVAKAAPAPTGPGAAAPQRTIPLATWGTNEVVLASRAAGPEARDRATDAAPPARDEEPATDDEPAAAPEKPKPATASTSARPDPQPGPPRLKRRAVTRPPVRTATATAPKSSAAAMRSKAEAAYRKKDFNGASETLRRGLDDLPKKDADSLRSLATNYEAIGVNLTKAQASETSNPTGSMAAYGRALALDKRAGGGAHAAYIRIKLGQVAPRAAASFMAQKRYEAAKKAADAAANYGAGSNATVLRVRAALERQAADFYKSAIGLKKSNPARAKALLRRIINMVPPDSPWYGKSYKLLNSRAPARDDDE